MGLGMPCRATGWGTVLNWKWGSNESYMLEREVPSALPSLASGMPVVPQDREWRHLLWRNCPQRKDLTNTCVWASPISAVRAPRLGCVYRHMKPCSQQALSWTSLDADGCIQWLVLNLWMDSRSSDLNVSNVKDRDLQKPNKT